MWGGVWYFLADLLAREQMHDAGSPGILVRLLHLVVGLVHPIDEVVNTTDVPVHLVATDLDECAWVAHDHRPGLQHLEEVVDQPLSHLCGRVLLEHVEEERVDDVGVVIDEPFQHGSIQGSTRDDGEEAFAQVLAELAELRAARGDLLALGGHELGHQVGLQEPPDDCLLLGVLREVLRDVGHELVLLGEEELAADLVELLGDGVVVQLLKAMLWRHGFASLENGWGGVHLFRI